MYRQTSSDQASRYVRNPGNRARRGDSARKGGRREARTSVTKTGVRAEEEASARFSGRLHDRRWRDHLPASPDKTLTAARRQLSPASLFGRDFENDLQLDWRAQWKTGDAENSAGGICGFAEH